MAAAQSSTRRAGRYQVQSGDTMSQIAARYRLQVGALMRFNPRVRPRALEPGDWLLIPKKSTDVPAKGPYLYHIRRGDTLSKLAAHFNISLLSLKQANADLNPKRLWVGQIVTIPVGDRGLNGYQWPVQKPNVVLSYSEQRWGVHQGLALKTAAHTKITAIAPGKVLFAGEMRGLGHVVIIDHRDGRQSIYAYCETLFVARDNNVSTRAPICSAGHQRRIDTNGIYFELREKGSPIPPLNYLPALP
ncbi:hypothetical protein BFW38_07055 [Terasakiispira papahanaumokuakeensis]|uniref:LysM domain-containing protein n=1 Tax=Terasakiispira papahanaumokuakeensis TaxID=197479 RepID=A0A1E2V8K5_9GAMM|nr:M23 family metallopeptidase [Terasakiispira papahanaumokuakeensis]ODC03340.1 hypothetical protein BFW38_07055 [Terasakiispira papahanaumokuakeensis]